MKFLYRYSIDVFSPSCISGWIRHRLHLDEVELLIKEDDTLLGECTANLLREDVKAQGLHPTEFCGFSFQLPDTYTASASKGALSVIVKKNGILLETLDSQVLGQVPQPRESFHDWFMSCIPPRKKRPVTFFMHIPKTAGTSFNSFARTLYNPKKVITHIEAYDPSAYPRITENYDFISGHLRMDSVKRYFCRRSDSKLYTLLREPFAHFHSHLNWLRSIGAQRESDFYKTHHAFFQELADQFAHKTNLTPDELQDLVDNVSGVLRKLLDNCQSRYFITTDPEKITPAHWQEISNSVRLFTLVGITEEYAAFRRSFCSQNCFRNAVDAESLNRSRFPKLYDYKDPVAQEIVRPLVSMDIQLYEAVRKGQGGKIFDIPGC